MADRVDLAGDPLVADRHEHPADLGAFGVIRQLHGDPPPPVGEVDVAEAAVDVLPPPRVLEDPGPHLHDPGLVLGVHPVHARPRDVVGAVGRVLATDGTPEPLALATDHRHRLHRLAQHPERAHLIGRVGERHRDRVVVGGPRGEAHPARLLGGEAHDHLVGPSVVGPTRRRRGARDEAHQRVPVVVDHQLVEAVSRAGRRAGVQERLGQRVGVEDPGRGPVHPRRRDRQPGGERPGPGVTVGAHIVPAVAVRTPLLDCRAGRTGSRLRRVGHGAHRTRRRSPASRAERLSRVPLLGSQPPGCRAAGRARAPWS
ncbi:MAG: hypothetical protein U5R31_00635 [Acidimicrobiia bacterium]|nr:hypothetical protein [Acidimicrobiia bacterium]